MLLESHPENPMLQRKITQLKKKKINFIDSETRILHRFTPNATGIKKVLLGTLILIKPKTFLAAEIIVVRRKKKKKKKTREESLDFFF